jgi:4-hydroxy-2-oxoheptanedioate aldolase
MEKKYISIMEITKQLEALVGQGVVGIKQSFEDEGVILDDVIKIKRLCDSLNLQINIKIGGCEAISDLNNSMMMGVSGIVAPMIESEFALSKFIESIISNTNELDRSSTDFFINIESKTAIENLDKILSSPSSKLLKGIVVGRSDLTKSYGYGKQQVTSKEICKVVKNTFIEAKTYNLKTIMGGNLGHSSILFIEELVAENLLDKIETRNVIIDLSKSGTKNMDELIKNALLFESQWMQYKAQFYNDIGTSYIKRSKDILDRISIR